MLRESREIIVRLRRDGFEPVSVRGSHHKFLHPGTRWVVHCAAPEEGLAGRYRRCDLQAGGLEEGRARVAYYIALIHKEAGSAYGFSFPDVPGVTTAADSIDEAMAQAAEVLAFAAEDWRDLTQRDFPRPRTIDELRDDPAVAASLADAIIAAVPFDALAHAA